MLYVGLDVHWKTSTLCILDENGKKIKTQTLRSNWKRLLDECRRIDEEFSVCFEASCGYGYLHEELSKMAARVAVAHPGQARLIFRSKRKNDRLDAEKLAKLLYLDEVPEAYVPAAVRQWREMIEYRQTLIAKRVRCKNGLRALLRSRGVVPPRGLWSKRNRLWLASCELGDVMAALRRDMLLDELASLDRQVQTVTKVLDHLGEQHAGVRLLQTIPGVGPRTAEAVVAYVADPHRFSNVRQVGAYFGLVPCEDSSAGAHRLGHITRQGPATVRKLLTEAAWQVVRRCPRTRERFERIHENKRDRRKTALVAIAHHLARSMVAMLKTGEPWRTAA